MRVGRKHDKVQILVSTYNGEKYLREQLESLLNQTHSHFFITIRDDGSSDKTKAIIQDYICKFPNQVEAFYEQNIGVIASFFDLFSSHVHRDTEYICFCDQDDVWMEDRLERGIRSLREYSGDRPIMYVTPTLMVNEMLQPLNSWPPVPQRDPSFYNALIENIAVGATIMINRSAAKMITSNLPNPNKIVMHDWWVYLTVSAFGEIIYDHEPSIYYRQHQGNVVGGQNGIKERIMKKCDNYLKHCHDKIYWNQAKEFERCWGEHLSQEFRRELMEFLLPNRGFFDRIRYSLTTRLYRQSMLDNLVFRLMMIKGDILK